MQIATPFRRNILSAFLLVTLFLGVSLLLGMYQAWLNHLENQRLLLLRDASTVSNYLQSTLVDASKLLEIARKRLDSNLANNQLSVDRAQTILSDTVNTFAQYNTSDRFGLLFCTKKDGSFFAANSGIKIESLNFSDRHYFTELKHHPDQSVAIGNLVRTRTTNQEAFHMAMPLKDNAGNFAGVVAQQILEADLSNQLQSMMIHSAAHVYTYATNDEISFAFPGSSLTIKESRPNPKQLLEIIRAQNSPLGFLKVPGNTIELPHSYYIGFSKSPQFGIYTIALVSELKVIKDFLAANVFTFAYSLLAFLIATALFIRLYRQALKLERSLFSATHDALTGINNRRCLDETFQSLWRESMRSQKPISVLFMDIDHFKRVNDDYGHEIGDQVLRAVSTAISKCLRRPLDFYCRWGGEEFVAVLPDTSLEGAKMIAADVLHTVETMDAMVPPIKITISIGIASQTVTSANQHDDLIDMADKAMLQAKVEGRNRYVCYNDAG